MLNTMVHTGSIAACLGLLWHFSNIVRYGEHLIREPNTAWLYAEVAIVAGLMVAITVNLIRRVKDGN